MHCCRIVRYGVAGLLSCLVVSCGAQAGPWTWDGGGADDFLTTGENWNPDAVPFFRADNNALNTDSALIFTGNVKTSPLVFSNEHYNGITFDANAAAFDFSGGLLRIG